MFYSKKAIQLSINFIVMLIISMVLLGIGFTFLNSVINTGSVIDESISTKLEQDIFRRMAESNQNVYIPSVTKKLKQDEQVRFEVAIKNSEDIARFYYLLVKFPPQTLSDGTPVIALDPGIPVIEQECISYLRKPGDPTRGETFKLEPDDKIVKLIGLEINDDCFPDTIAANPPRGQYAFDVYVCKRTPGTHELPCADDGGPWQYSIQKPKQRIFVELS